jgi:hypothetical protein
MVVNLADTMAFLTQEALVSVQFSTSGRVQDGSNLGFCAEVFQKGHICRLLPPSMKSYSDRTRCKTGIKAWKQYIHERTNGW